MHPSDLIKLGEMLHGERWQTALSLDLGVSDRTMRYWVAGKHQIPQGAIDDLLILAAAKQVERLLQVIHEIGAMPEYITLSAERMRLDLSTHTTNAILREIAQILKENGMSVNLI